jgi:hypothetical protein
MSGDRPSAWDCQNSGPNMQMALSGYVGGQGTGALSFCPRLGQTPLVQLAAGVQLVVGRGSRDYGHVMVPAAKRAAFKVAQAVP